jgi:hypothetical protein
MSIQAGQPFAGPLVARAREKIIISSNQEV